MNQKNQARTLHLLETWVRTARKELVTVPGHPELCYYGDGSNGWGVQTNQKAFAGFAVVAALTKDSDILEDALRMLRYSLSTHKTGTQELAHGEVTQWGHTWISILGVERMMVGVEAIDFALTDADRKQLRDMLISEAQYQLTVTVVADIDGKTGKNKPESNAWNGALLWRVAEMYPDHPQAEEFRAKGVEFLLAGISVPDDAFDETVVEGKAVKDWFVGANYTDAFALNHHGYLNLGYMVITLSQIAMLHFSLRNAGITPPDFLYRHTNESWQLIRSWLFDDGRLCRIGGDTRVRYCYCQDFLLHCLIFARDAFGEEVDALVGGWLDKLDMEMDYNNDGTFLSRRVELFVERSPLYYTRLESDRAVSLAFLLYYDGMKKEIRRPLLPTLSDWEDDFHGATFTRGEKRIASFAWNAAEGPTALCVPAEDSSMAEWRQNMTGFIEGNGSVQIAHEQKFGKHTFSGGFVNYGNYFAHTSGLLEEQISEEDIVNCHVAFAALPDDATVVTLQVAQAMCYCQCISVLPFHLYLPNDVFNQFQRDYVFSDDRRTLCIDNKLTVHTIGKETLSLRQPPYRQIGLSLSHGAKFAPYQQRGMLHCDEISVDPQEKPRFYNKNEILYDIAVSVTVGTPGASLAAAQTVRLPDYPTLRAVVVRGQDEKDYALLFHFGEGAISGTFDFRGVSVPFALEAGEAQLYPLNS